MPAAAWSWLCDLAPHVLGIMPMLVRRPRLPWDPRVLDSPISQRILELLFERRAFALAELRHLFPSRWSTVQHHLNVLVASGALRLATVGGRRVVVSLLEDVPDTIVHAAALLRNPATRRVARHIIDHPGIDIRDVCTALQESRRVVYDSVKRLRDAGLLRTPKPGSYAEMYAGPELQAVLRHHA